MHYAALQSNPNIANQNLVHEGGVVKVEIVDGSIKATYEAASGFENAPKDLHHVVVKDLDTSPKLSRVDLEVPNYGNTGEGIVTPTGATVSESQGKD